MKKLVLAFAAIVALLAPVADFEAAHVYTHSAHSNIDWD